MKQIIEQSVKPLTTVKMASLFQIYLKPNEDFYRVEHQIRLHGEEEYRPHREVVKQTIDEAREWIREEMEDSNLEKTYEMIELANNAMAEFYSQTNRSKYLYNE